MAGSYFGVHGAVALLEPEMSTRRGGGDSFMRARWPRLQLLLLQRPTWTRRYWTAVHGLSLPGLVGARA